MKNNSLKRLKANTTQHQTRGPRSVFIILDKNAGNYIRQIFGCKE